MGLSSDGCCLKALDGAAGLVQDLPVHHMKLQRLSKESRLPGA